MSSTRGFPLESLRSAIADVLWKQLSAPKLPAACVRLGLADGDPADANRSKRAYVRDRITSFSAEQLLALAQRIIDEYGSPELEDFISESTLRSGHRISDLTRREILKALDGIGELFGDLNIFDGLAAMQLDLEKDSPRSNGWTTLRGDIQKHYVEDPDLSNLELLELCGALTCSQRRFFALLEKLVEPICRRGETQEHLVVALNKYLAADGFALQVAGDVSRHPLYAVRPIAAGVNGAPKNLIFASINRKPDLYFIDAINNDVAIGNDSDALIYDRPISGNGLYWPALAAWWQERDRLPSLADAKKHLGARLRRAVRATASPGEVAIFETYYKHFAGRLGDKLPALVPQVYLHYDPRSAFERGSSPVLARQRMDFLLLLSHGTRVVIEVDGKHHYARGDSASPSLYAAMAAEDRRLRLQGYEVYRFGAAEFTDVERVDASYSVGPVARQLIIEFFEKLLVRHVDPDAL